MGNEVEATCRRFKASATPLPAAKHGSRRGDESWIPAGCPPHMPPPEMWSVDASPIPEPAPR